jgi:hypothetical protein
LKENASSHCESDSLLRVWGLALKIDQFFSLGSNVMNLKKNENFFVFNDIKKIQGNMA